MLYRNFMFFFKYQIIELESKHCYLANMGHRPIIVQKQALSKFHFYLEKNECYSELVKYKYNEEEEQSTVFFFFLKLIFSHLNFGISERRKPIK